MPGDTPRAEGLPSYADALAELDAILDELEAGDVDIDALAARVERAADAGAPVSRPARRGPHRGHPHRGRPRRRAGDEPAGAPRGGDPDDGDGPVTTAP